MRRSGIDCLTTASGRCRPFTLIELLIVIAIIFILAAILFPALINSKARGKQAKCINRSKQMTVAMAFYSDEFGGYFPLDTDGNPLTEGRTFWHQKIKEHLGENGPPTDVVQFMNDPGMPAEYQLTANNESNYMFNENLNSIGQTAAMKFVQVVKPSQTMMIICGSTGVRFGTEAQVLSSDLQFPHPVVLKQADVTFVDGHVRPTNRSDTPTSGADVFWDPTP